MNLIAAAGLPSNWRRAAYRQQPLDEHLMPAAGVLLRKQTVYVADTEEQDCPDPFDPAVRTIAAVPLQDKILFDTHLHEQAGFDAILGHPGQPALVRLGKALDPVDVVEGQDAEAEHQRLQLQSAAWIHLGEHLLAAR